MTQMLLWTARLEEIRGFSIVVDKAVMQIYCRDRRAINHAFEGAKVRQWSLGVMPAISEP